MGRKGGCEDKHSNHQHADRHPDSSDSRRYIRVAVLRRASFLGAEIGRVKVADTSEAKIAPISNKAEKRNRSKACS